jgi:hypothetical protein
MMVACDNVRRAELRLVATGERIEELRDRLSNTSIGSLFGVLREDGRELVFAYIPPGLHGVKRGARQRSFVPARRMFLIAFI